MRSSHSVVRLRGMIDRAQIARATIIDRTPFLLTHCSNDLRYLYVSKAYAAMLDLTPEEIAGKPIVEIMGQDGYETIRPYVEAVLRGHRVEFEAEVHFAQVGQRYLHVIYVPERNTQHQVIGWIGSILDVTEQKQTEAKHLDSEARFRDMANHA